MNAGALDHGAPGNHADPADSAGFGPVRDAAGHRLDQIRLVGVTARGRHGVLAAERLDGQDFVVDAVLHLDLGKAAATDDLAATVDYGALATRLADVVRGDPVDLIETLAQRLATAALATSPLIHAVDIVIHKPSAPIPESFADVVIAIRRERERDPDSAPSLGSESRSVAEVAGVAEVVLALGANLGDRVSVLRAAVREIGELPGVWVDAVSPVVETAPVGGPEQPDYLNAVVLARTELPPLDLLHAVQAIEAGQGRERTVRWGPRTLDIDVIRYGDRLDDDPELQLPHPRAAGRAFVLAPWLAADAAAWLPGPGGRRGRRPIGGLLAAAADRDDVRARPDITLTPSGDPEAAS
jgi:dihydroneopterin aldolase / 2-amino-4-hydroxy-6-hydroxymethyldihydropteridine diphosphokinase